MTGICASIGSLQFRTIKEALHDARIPYDEKNSIAILLWEDSIQARDYFSHLRPWQVVNRIPSINLLCRKSPLATLLNKAQKGFPHLYNMFPKSFDLPRENDEFLKELSKTTKKYLIKPDMGALGNGITFVEPGQPYTPNDQMAVAQEYIDSYLLNNTKFDLRIYVLVASINPLTIYVYRNGLARFCSEESSVNSVYAQLTNVALNKGNPEMEIERISQLISDIYPKLAAKGVNIDELWARIDNAIILTILSALKYLERSESVKCPSLGYSHCFQILGFDILLDPNLNPTVLEVNYRPLLDYFRGKERRMKVRMVKEAIQIAVPLSKAQEVVLAKKWSLNDNNWTTILQTHQEILQSAYYEREKALKKSNYVRVFPSPDSELQYKYNEIIQYVRSQPFEPIPGFEPR